MIKKHILKILICSFLLSCSDSNDDLKEDNINAVSNLEVKLLKDNPSNIKLYFETVELYQCPTTSIPITVEKQATGIILSIEDKFAPQYPCFAIYDPKKATAVIDIGYLNLSGTYPVIINFKGEVLKGEITITDETSSFTLEDNCCININLS